MDEQTGPEALMEYLNRHRVAARAATILAAITLFAPVSAATAANANWSGASTNDTWSSPGNWRANAAPSGSVGVLALPPASARCGGWSCSFGVDDIPSLSVGTLSIDSSNNYLVTPLDSGDAIELVKGLSFTTRATPASNRLLTKMVVPLTLGAAQNWTVAGVSGNPTELALGAVTGESYPLTVHMSGGVTLQAADLDTGPLRLTGGGDVVLAAQMAEPADDVPAYPPPLISARGITLARGASLDLSSPDVVSGAISVAPGSYSTLQIGHGVAPDGTATVDGDVTLRANSTLQLWIDQADPTGKPQPSTDASQLTVSGTLDLAGAGLALSQGFTDTQVDCASLSDGQVYTLVSATRLVGTFAGIANHQVVDLGVCDPLRTTPAHAVLISYNTRARPQTITATVVGPAQIKALVADTLPVTAATLGSVLGTHGYTTSFSAPTAGRLSLSWTAVSGGRRITVARGSNVAGRIGLRSVPLKLTAAGERLLYRDDHPPAPKPKRVKVKSKGRHKGKGKGKSKPKYKLIPQPPPPPKPVQITATVTFAPSGQKLVRLSRRFTLRAQ
ncbi:MAG TPA: hypothetical protein VHU61_14460 [Solirubrobacteraceae bacterium]|nr:hypothetical protein [Solirubrobacteraceae bacterium]